VLLLVVLVLNVLLAVLARWRRRLDGRASSSAGPHAWAQAGPR
jgi:hypothetical protein